MPNFIKFHYAHRIKLTSLAKFALILFTFGIILVGGSKSAFADIIVFDPDTNIGAACSSGSSMCYSNDKLNYGGGVVWAKVPLPASGTKKVTFKNLDATYYAKGTSPSQSSIDCTSIQGATHAYFFSWIWHKNGKAKFANYLFGPKILGSYSNTSDVDYRTDLHGYSWSDATTIISADDAKSVFLSWAPKSSYCTDSSSCQSYWNAGNFSAFCGADTPPSDDFSVKTGVFYAGGAISVDQNSADTGWNGPNVAINLHVAPGAEIELHFNSYVKTASVPTPPPAKTDYGVDHTGCSGLEQCDKFNNQKIAQWAQIELNDTGEDHSVIKDKFGAAADVTHYKIKIPDDTEAGKTFELCEAATIKDKGPSDSSTKTTKACAKLIVDEITAVEGKSQVSGGESGGSEDSGWGVANESPVLSDSIDLNRGDTKTITVNFDHWLRNNSEHTVSNVPWSVKTDPSIVTTGSGISVISTPSQVSGQKTIAAGAEEQVASNRTYKLQVSYDPDNVSTIKICETLRFKTTPNSTSSDLNGWTRACYMLTVNAIPDPPQPECPISGFIAPATGTKSYGETKVASGVAKNGDIGSTYNPGGIYAKIKDKFGFAHCYFPEAQAVMSTYEEGKAHHPNPENPGASYTDAGYAKYVAIKNRFSITSDELFQLTDGSGRTFNPAQYYNFSEPSPFSITSGQNSLLTKFKGKEKEGDTSAAIVYSHGTSQYDIKKGSAGTALKQTIETEGENAVVKSEKADHCWCNGYSCSCGGDPDPSNCCCEACHTNYYTGSHTGDVSDYAWLYIPYNFKTKLTTEINSNGASDQTLFGDRSVIVNATVTLKKRQNNTTEGNYVTEPPDDTKVQVITFFLKDTDDLPLGSISAGVSDDNACSYFGNRVNDCRIIKEYGNRSAWMGTDYPDPDSDKEYRFDGLSGSVENIPSGYKFCSAAAISHTDSGDDINSYVGPDGPAAQVNNNWNISNPTCRTIVNIPSIQVWGGHFFSDGTVSTSVHEKPSNASVAAGLRAYGSWAEFALIAGGTNGTFKNITSGASIAYDGVFVGTSTLGGHVNGLSDFTTKYKDLSPMSIISLTSGTSVQPSGIIASSNSILNRLKARYPSCDTSNSIGGITVGPGETKVYCPSGEVTITGDITLTDASLSDISQIPQVVILAENDVKISGSVSRIDAWIIAPGQEVDTCADYKLGDNLNSTACNKLKLNGPVIAKNIVVDRGGGASTEENTNYYSQGKAGSGTKVQFNTDYNTAPAEIFNLSPANYLWAYAEATKQSKATTVYTRELAPRL